MIICSMALAFKKGEWHSLINRMTNDLSSEYGLVQIPDTKQKELLQSKMEKLLKMKEIKKE